MVRAKRACPAGVGCWSGKSSGHVHPGHRSRNADVRSIKRMPAADAVERITRFASP